jgi:hypothetical protein
MYTCIFLPSLKEGEGVQHAYFVLWPLAGAAPILREAAQA